MDFYSDRKAVSELSSIYLQLDEISADTALAASKEADKKRGQLAAAGDKEGAAKKAKQASTLYKKQADKRLNRESLSNWRDDLRELVQLDKDEEKVVKEKNVKNKVVIDPEIKLEQALGGKVLAIKEEDDICDGCGQTVHEGECKAPEADYTIDPIDEAKKPKKENPEQKEPQLEESDEYIDTVQKKKQAEHEADLKRWKVEESILWDRIARDLTRLGEEYGCKFKVEGYQRNPEKGEEEERKAEKRRKESGRMPPRGDKRREDFEKWYAANVR